MRNDIEKLFPEIKRLRESGYTFTAIANELNIAPHDAKNAYTRHIKQKEDNEREEITDDMLDAIESLIKENVDKKKNRAYQSILNKKINRAGNESILAEAIRESVHKVATPELLRINDLYPDMYVNKYTAVLFLSDIHLGQMNKESLTSGWVYNSEKAKQQFIQLTKLVADECMKRQVNNLVIIDLGDDIDGDALRPSHNSMVDMSAVKQCMSYANLFSSFSTSLLSVVNTIDVYRVPGNHARISQKPGLGGLDEISPSNSFDWLAGEIIKEICASPIEDDRMHIYNLESIHGYIQVSGVDILFEHGSALKGNSSIGIPFTALRENVAKYSSFEGNIDIYAIGHYHHFSVFSVFMNTLCLTNGSFVPTSPYVLNQHKSVIRPSQTLLMLQKGEGVREILPLWL